MNILIPEPMRRNILAAVRSLGRRGNCITLAVTRPRAAAKEKPFSRFIEWLSRSRHISNVLFISSRFDGVDAYVSDIIDVVKQGHFDVVLPFSHVSTGCCSYGKAQIEQFAGLPIADIDRFMTFHNKWNTLQLARSLGVPIPETHWPQDLRELQELAPRLTYPAVVKAHIGCGVRRGIRYAKDKDELLQKYREVTSNKCYSFLDDFSRPLIQEYIPGSIHDVASICSNGRLRGALTQVRAITYPLSGGVGAVNVTTNEPEMLALAKRLLEAVGWHGPALVEFKLDARDNTYKLLEVNPKFWGTTDLSIQAGIDFPMMACEIATSGDTSPQFDYKVGLTYRWATGYELLCVAQSPHKMKAVAGYVGRFFRKDTRYDFCATDPMPDVMAMLRGGVGQLRRNPGLPEEESLEASRGNS